MWRELRKIARRAGADDEAYRRELRIPHDALFVSPIDGFRSKG